MTRQRELAEGLASVRRRLDAAAAASDRDADDIELLPVTKFFPASDVAILSGLGCRSFGESREQEAVAKTEQVANLVDEPVHWHMIGQIQRNKARSIARWAYAVHSVSSTKVVTALDRAAAAALDAGERTEALGVYVQVSLDGDTPPQAGGAPTRGGVDVGSPTSVDEICGEVAAAASLRLVGLMAIPPLDADPEQAFARLAEEHRRVLRGYPAAVGLSAGMSDDLEAAVKHGSTCVRVGTALLGKRPLTSPSVVTPVTSSSPTEAFRKGHR